MKKNLISRSVITILLSAGFASATTIFPATDGEFLVRRNSNSPSIENNLHVKKEGATNNDTDRFGLIRFNSTTDFGPSVTAASFLITAGNAGVWNATYIFNVWGVIDGDAQDEAIVRTTYAPGAPSTLYANTPAQIDTTQVVSLGTFSASANTATTFSNAALLAFIQADTNGIATFALTRSGGTGNSVFVNVAGAANDAQKPQLVVVPEPSALLLCCLGIPALLSRRMR